MSIEWVHHLEELRPHPKSIEIYGDDGYEDLVESVKELGVLQPIYATPEGVIISGYRRWRAAKAAQKPVPVIRKSYAERLDEERDIIEFNRYRIKSGQQLYNEGKELERIEAEKARARIKEHSNTAPGRKATPVEKLPPVSQGKTRDIVAKTIGLGSGKQWDKLKYVATHSPGILPLIKLGGMSLNRAYKLAQHQQIETLREEFAREGEKTKLPPEITMRNGDFRNLGSSIPDNSVDLVFCDPNYGQDYLDCWEPLAELAARVLRPGKFLIAYSGQSYLDHVIRSLGKHLVYHWAASRVFRHGQGRAWHRNVWLGWKPLLIFRKQPEYGHAYECPWFTDVVYKGGGEGDKDLHDYGQAVEDAAYFISKFTHEGELVLDPFCGSGTTLLAAKSLGRRALGFEVDPKIANIARRRLVSDDLDLIDEGEFTKYDHRALEVMFEQVLTPAVCNLVGSTIYGTPEDVVKVDYPWIERHSLSELELA